MKQKFHSSLDRQFQATCAVFKPDRYRQLLDLKPGRPISIQGAGVSYAPLSFGTGTTVLNMSHFDRILSFDPKENVIEVEAGASLGKIFDFLYPRGLHLSVQPGHPQITVGGCIGVNIHGKNQYREGLFHSLVLEITLLHPQHGLLRLSRTDNPEWFELTCGGFGLTGIIVIAKLKATPLPGQQVHSKNVAVSSLLETVELMNELKDQVDLLYSWNDLTVPNSKLGMGFVVTGKFESAPHALIPAGPLNYKMLNPHRKARFKIPAYNRLSCLLLNRMYRRVHLGPFQETLLPIPLFTYPVLNKLIYFDLFGRKGFVERQMMVPANRIKEYLKEFEILFKAHQPLIVLTTFKIFSGDQRFLRYDGTGYSFSLDILNNSASRPFNAKLDELNVRYGVMDNLAKDSRISRALAEKEYPEYARFRDSLHRFDPSRTFSSELSERIGL